jgi:hypothetical protein
MNRRAFLRQLLAGSALTAAGLYVPTKTYSFLWDNPLAKPDLRVPLRHAWGGLLLVGNEGVWRVGPDGKHATLISETRGVLAPETVVRPGERLYAQVAP